MNNHLPQEFLLADKDNKPVKITGNYWKAEEIYLNNICIAVKLKLIKINDELENIKEALYSLLMSIVQTALDHDLLRPVAGIISIDNLGDDILPKDIKKWGSDQDWHRGDFILFIEQDEDKVKERIFELVESCLGEGKFIDHTIDRMLNSGAIDIEDFEDNYVLSKWVLTAILKNMMFQFSPITDEGKEFVDNLKHF